MKKFLAVMAALLLPMMGFAQYSSDFRELAPAVGAGFGAAAGFVIFLLIIYVGILVLTIILFIKMWIMCNDVKKLKKYFIDKIERP